MKKGNFSKLVLLSALTLPAYAEKVQFDQLPPDLQQKIRAQVGSAQIEDIDRDVKNGRTTYEVGYKENGQHREARFEHNDTSPAPSTTTTSVDSRKISYDELPQNVRNAVSSYVEGAEVNDVDRQVKDGRVTYEIGYKKRDTGAQREILVSDDGRILDRSIVPGSRASTGSTAINRPNRDRGDRNVDTDRRDRESRGVNWGNRSTANASTRSMEYSDLPSPVRRAADDRLRNGDVKQVYRLVQNGNINYQIDFEKEDGRNQQLLVTEEGRIIRDQFLRGSAVGAPATTQSGTSSSTTTTSGTEYSHVTQPVQLQSARDITRAQLPAGVTRAMRSYTSNANIKEIRRGTWDGREVYQVGFVDNNNQYVQLQLDASGNVIHDPRRNTGSSTGNNLLNNIGRLLDNN